jgi:hypothetical protein
MFTGRFYCNYITQAPSTDQANWVASSSLCSGNPSLDHAGIGLENHVEPSAGNFGTDILGSSLDDNFQYSITNQQLVGYLHNENTRLNYTTNAQGFIDSSASDFGNFESGVAGLNHYSSLNEQFQNGIGFYNLVVSSGTSGKGLLDVGIENDVFLQSPIDTTSHNMPSLEILTIGGNISESESFIPFDNHPSAGNLPGINFTPGPITAPPAPTSFQQAVINGPPVMMTYQRTHCTQPGCTQTVSRRTDLPRHLSSVHGINQRRHLCPHATCPKSHGAGYSRSDKLNEHLWKSHGAQRRVRRP